MPLPSIGLLVLAAVADDPRVRRQGDAFAAAGWRVEAFGIPGARAPDPAWRITNLSSEEAARGPSGLLESTAARTRRRLAKIFGLVKLPFSHDAWPSIYWNLDTRFEAIRSLAASQHCDIWLANDWQMLPIALDLAKRQGAIAVYDTHELANSEYSDNLRWRLLHRPLIRAVEGSCVQEAALVTCVSSGIAATLQRDYSLPKSPLVIRNMPPWTPVQRRPIGETVRALYHGVVSPGRGLELCVRSVALWPEHYTLTIRGPIAPGYRERLKQEIASAGVAKRVTLVDPVPVTELVAAASAFDIGLFCLPTASLQNQLALPNKLFEYTMAGLALCVSAQPEMARMVQEHDLGVLIPSDTPEAIAAAITSLDTAAIARYQANALRAAQALNWEHEAQTLVSACEALLTHRSKPA